VWLQGDPLAKIVRNTIFSGYLADRLIFVSLDCKLVAMLASYTEDINRLLKANPGLSSRFREDIEHDAFSSYHTTI
jgi:hypothetical protein